ncbi:hypothetical protein GCM10018954_075410 [Kutzneria kofuensis]
MVDAQYYVAESEGGDVVADPSEDALYMRISDLVFPDNSFVTIQPPGERDDWHVVVALLEEGGYEVEYRHKGRGEHRVVNETEISDIAHEVIIWLGDVVRRTHKG